MIRLEKVKGQMGHSSNTDAPDIPETIIEDSRGENNDRT